MEENSFTYVDGVGIDEIDSSQVAALAFHNSAFLWGESIFTSGLVVGGQMTLWPAHADRLLHSFEWQFGRPLKSWQAIEQQIGSIMQKHPRYHGRFRVTFFYRDSSEHHHWLMTLKPLAIQGPLSLQTHPRPFRHFDDDARVKRGSYADFYRVRRLSQNDPCWHDGHGKMLETSHGNLLFYEQANKQWMTPYSDHSLLDGIGLRHGLAKLDVRREEVYLHDLRRFSAAFQVNAVHGPVPIERIDDKTMHASHDLLPLLKTLWQEACQ